jgi:hypothetical protein
MRRYAASGARSSWYEASVKSTQAAEVAGNFERWQSRRWEFTRRVKAENATLSAEEIVELIPWHETEI